MKKLFIAVLLVFACASLSFATDWSQYESGRNNIRLDGYDGQPGYIAFTNGSGTTLGYLFVSSNHKLIYVSANDISLASEKLGSQSGSDWGSNSGEVGDQ